MSKEEEAPTRVTRGALRRMSVEQEPTSTPGTPKKSTTVTKKSAVLDAIQEGSTGPSDVEDDSAARSSMKGNKSLSRVKEQEAKPALRSRAASLTEENVSILENLGELRRTPRRRPSQDTTLTPQTAPAAGRRKTRRNSATSDDGNMPATTPKASKSRLSVAPPTIAEDDEKEDKVNSSNVTIAEAELSDLDIRKLRNRAISNSPVPRSSPSGKNTSMGSHKEDEGESNTSKPASPVKEAQEATKGGSVSMSEVLSVSDASVDKSPAKSDSSKSALLSPVGSVKKQQKDVKFEEGTPRQLNKSEYPKTPIVASGEKRRKLSEKDAAEAADKSQQSAEEVIDETILESPQQKDRKAATPKTASAKKPDQSLNESIDNSLAIIVHDVRENINQVDQSLTIFDTPKPTGKHKSHFSNLREGKSSTPIAKLVEIEEEKASESPASKSWSQAVKGSSSDKGIDVFSVRKQEEEQRQEEQTKQLNESLKRKSLEKKVVIVDDDDEEEDDEDQEEEEEEDDAPKGSSFVDDEAMEVEDYESGDSLDSETREEMEANELDEGETLGSEDTDRDDEEEENDSFIASEEEEFELLDGSGDDLASDEENKGKKKRKRIIQQEDSSDEEQSVIKLDESTASENKSPKKTPKKADLNKSLSDQPKSPKKTPKKADLNSSNADQPKSPKKTPAKDTPEAASKTPIKTPAKTPPTEDEKQAASPKKSPANPKSPMKTPAKSPAQNDGQKTDETKQAKSAEKHSTKTMEPDSSDAPTSRKSLPAPALISADFYSSSAKKAKRNTINVLANDGEQAVTETEPEESAALSSTLVTNPAALALAKRNKRLSLGASPAEAASKRDKRSSLPGKLPQDKEIESPLKRKKAAVQQDAIPEDTVAETAQLDPPEPMDVDEDESEVEEASPVRKPVVALKKKKAKDLSEFDTEAILARCNEIVRSDKEKRKQGATFKQKKKDEKRKQREQEQQEEAVEANESTEQQKKKKKKKKKPINYLLEELGEKKEDQVAKALQRKMAILEAKRDRKKAKKAAKLKQQLDKENQQEDKKEGIGAKFEKKVKKEKKTKQEPKVAIEEVSAPVVKRAVSAFAMYSAQIEELKKEEADKRKPKSKQLKEKNQHPPSSAVDEVQGKAETKSKKDKQTKSPTVASEPAPASEENHKENKKNEVPPETSTKHDQQKKKGKAPTNESAEVASKKHTKPEKKTDKPPVSESFDKSGKPEHANTAPLKSVVSFNEDELAKLKKSLAEPVTKVIKKQKLSQNESNAVTVSVKESTPPRKLKALSRLEVGFREEPVTPDHKLLKRNHGFMEEPVTPKTIGFKVSNVLPAGQEALQQQAALAKKKKTYPNSNRIRPEDVKEPTQGLPQPIWTRSGSFEVQELVEAKSKKSKAVKPIESDFVPLNVNGSTDFLVKPLGGKKKERSAAGASKAHRVDLATVDESVINFKKQAIFGKNAHLREKKAKH